MKENVYEIFNTEWVIGYQYNLNFNKIILVRWLREFADENEIEDVESLENEFYSGAFVKTALVSRMGNLTFYASSIPQEVLRAVMEYVDTYC